MLFTNKRSEMMYVLHYPNDLYHERPQFKRIVEENNLLVIT